jgi:glucokinase
LNVFVGVDLGGSSLKAVATDGEGKILQHHEVTAGGKIPLEDLVRAVKAAIAHVAPRQPSAVGIVFGGAIQPDGTMLPTSTNLPNLSSLPLVQFFEQELQASIRIDNDARAAMRGEAWSGAARGTQSAIALTLGTGIGSGIMLQRKIWSGSHGRAGEIGVWKMNDPTQQDWPTLEETSSPARVRAASGKSFAELFASGEASTMISRVGRAIASAHLLLDLDMAVLLGGVAAIGEPLRHAVEEAFQRACQEDYHPGFSIRLGEHGAMAGAVGAASLWKVEM